MSLTPYLASIVLGLVSLIYVTLVALHYREAGRLELKHKIWLRTATLLAIVAAVVALINILT